MNDKEQNKPLTDYTQVCRVNANHCHFIRHCPLIYSCLQKRPIPTFDKDINEGNHACHTYIFHHQGRKSKCACNVTCIDDTVSYSSFLFVHMISIRSYTMKSMSYIRSSYIQSTIDIRLVKDNTYLVCKYSRLNSTI
jgi:hypothetical protein